jgi:hypothetical protein
MKRFEKRRREQPSATASASRVKLNFSKLSGGSDALTIAAQGSTPQVQVESIDHIHLATATVNTAILQVKGIPWEDLSKYNYKGQSLLLAEKDLRRRSTQGWKTR